MNYSIAKAISLNLRTNATNQYVQNITKRYSSHSFIHSFIH